MNGMTTVMRRRVMPNLLKTSQVLTAMVVAFLFCLPLSAQLNTGRISGQITDQSGGAIAGARVTVIDIARGENRVLAADAAGEYAAPNLTPGIYTVRAEFMGFKTVDRQNVEVGVGSDNRVDITLQPGEQTQTVTVTEALPIVNTTNAQTGGVLDTQYLSNLPINGRNYRWQANYVPGVVEQVGEGQSSMYVNGTPVSNGMFNFIIDGLYSESVFTLDPEYGGVGEAGDTTLLPLDAIQEVNVVLNPKAEYGWAPGITEDIGLKSGTNSIHGSAYAYGRDQAFDARNPFSFSPTTGQPTRGPVAFEQYGATLGGPIKKNKLFYFLGYEAEQLSVPSNFQVTDPTTSGATTAALGTTGSIPQAIAGINNYIAGHPGTNVRLSQLSVNLAGCNWNAPAGAISSAVATTVANACQNVNQFGAPGLFNNTSSTSTTENNAFPDYGGSNNGLWKLDYHINDHHTVNGSLFIARYGEYAVPTSNQTFTQQYWEEYLAVAAEAGRLVEVWTPNSNWLNQARVGVDHASRPVVRGECTSNGDISNPSGVGAASGGSVGGVAGPNYLTQYGLVTGAPGCGIPTISISGFTGKLGFANNRVDWENPIQGADSVSYTRGSHQFKFGVDIRAENFDGAKVLDSQSGVIAFGSTGFNAFASASPLEDFLAGVPATESIRPTTNIRHITTNKLALFAQDDWRVEPRLILNLGLRWEGETPERDANGLIGNFAPGTTTGMLQTNQIFKFQSDFEPRLGLAWDVTGKGTTVIRSGGGVMYMIPMVMNFIAGGNGLDYGGEPTGATLFYANGTTTNLPGGTITSALSAPSAITVGSGSNGVVIANGGLPWTAGSALFPSLTPQCGNGLAINPANPPTLPGGGNPVNPAPCTGQGGDPNIKLFGYAFWNLNVQHAFTNNVSLDVGYVGSRSWDIQEVINLNQPLPGISGGTTEQGREPFLSGVNGYGGVVYPWFSTINYYGNFGGSAYAGLQMNLTARNVHGLTFNANYTLSHGLAQAAVTDSAHPLLDYGNNGFDARNHFTLTTTYAIPGRKAPGQMLEGWAVNASVNVLSALPLNLTDSKDDLAGTGSTAAVRWDLYGSGTPFNQILGGVGLLTCYGVAASGANAAGAFAKAGTGCITVPAGTGAPGSSTYVSNMPTACVAGATAAGTSPNVPTGSTGYNGLAQLAAIGCYAENGSAMVPPPQGTFGTMTANELRGKGYGLLNASVTKDWKIKERLTTQFRAEVFNLLNRTQYAGAGTNLGTPSALGLATSTPDVSKGNPVVGSGGPRAIQLALRLTF